MSNIHMTSMVLQAKGHAIKTNGIRLKIYKKTSMAAFFEEVLHLDKKKHLAVFLPVVETPRTQIHMYNDNILKFPQRIY